nr:hypothetical protein [uncultured Lichenicoccus sp.]
MLRLPGLASIFVLASIFAITLSPAAHAGCGDAVLKQKLAYRSQGSENNDLFQLAGLARPSMVGMWAIKFVSQGVQTDFGYSVWHSDGTEFLNSGSRAPATQNYCLGVWKQTGYYTYKLNHYALSYDMNGNYEANVNIKEAVTLDHGGDSFSGTFTIDAYDPKTGAHLGAQLAGTIAGSRVTVD